VAAARRQRWTATLTLSVAMTQGDSWTRTTREGVLSEREDGHRFTALAKNDEGSRK